MKSKIIIAVAFIVVATVFSILGTEVFSSKQPQKVVLASFTTTGCTSNIAKITVNATGSAAGTPDTINVLISINESAGSAAAALASDNSQTSTVISSLTSLGVVSSDIQTTNFSLSPTYNSKFQITGYSASNNISVKITNLANAGNIIDQAENSIGNAGSIQSIYFSVSNTSNLQASAKANAVVLANSEAQAMADAAGEHISGICSIADQSSSPNFYPYALGSLNFAANSAATVPLEPGTQTVTDQLTVVFGLKS